MPVRTLRSPSSQLGNAKMRAFTHREHLLVWDSKPRVPGSPINWVELKTSQEIRGQGDMDAFNRKLMKFWIQSFLLGVPKIIVGFRTREGILAEVKEIETHTIPEIVNAGPNPQWNADMCVNFAAAFLDCKTFYMTTVSSPISREKKKKKRRELMRCVYRVEEHNYRGRRLENKEKSASPCD